MRFAPSIAFLACTLATGPVLAKGLERLVPHRAVYEVTLEEASERSGITGIKGRMVYETRGSACDGFSIRFRFFQNVRTQRREYSSDQRTTTFEAGDGQRYEFVNRTFFNGAEEKEVKGSVERKDEALSVSISKPAERSEELPGAIFPAAHLAAILDAANEGKRFLAADVFDGSDDGDAYMATNSVIGRPNPVETPTDVADEPAAKLAKTPSWHVNVAYFEGNADASGERLPVYQVSFPLYANGVSGNLTMRYDDYALKARLTDLEYLEKPACEPN